MSFPSGLREAVTSRAGHRCEYCQLAQAGQEATFHIDHVIPRGADGPSNEDNLALACVSCSLRKGARMIVADPETGQLVSLYNPRIHKWESHFRWENDLIVGLTATGRATIDALSLNRPLIRAIRLEEIARRRHPPQNS